MALDYELGHVLEPATAPPDWLPQPEQPLIRYWRFARCERLDRDAGEARLATWLPDTPAGIGEISPGLTEEAYCAAVDRIQRWISAGDCYQVNFTFPIHFAWYGDALALYAALRRAQPVRYGGFVGTRTSAILSLSPELFIERQGNVLRTRPMKGTLARSEDPARLLASEKDRAENLMIVDLLRNDLGRIAETGSVQVERLFDIEDYPSVWQMVSTVTARLGQRRFSEVLRALFPCGSITGAPKIRAMQIIHDLEGAPRGLYTGALGWLAPSGDFRLNVAIRTLVLDAGWRGRMGVGSGVVADSDARAEWQECLLKSRFLTRLPQRLVLIETLRCEAGEYPRLSLHLARLRHSALSLGFAFDQAAVEAALAGVAAPGCWRVRLTLNQAGVIEVAKFALAAESTIGREAILAMAPIDPDDLLRRHKTSERSLYDAALQQLNGDPALFDIVFLNTRGEVAEGARSTVFVEREGRLLTPPVSSGALPGVLRAELLASGQAIESVLRVEDLAAGFYLGNALRGLIPVRLRSTR